MHCNQTGYLLLQATVVILMTSQALLSISFQVPIRMIIIVKPAKLTKCSDCPEVVRQARFKVLCVHLLIVTSMLSQAHVAVIVATLHGAFSDILHLSVTILITMSLLASYAVVVFGGRVKRMVSFTVRSWQMLWHVHELSRWRHPVIYAHYFVTEERAFFRKR